MFYSVYSSPLGSITLATNGEAVTALHLEGDRYFTAIPSEWEQHQTDPVLVRAAAELSEYFAGTRAAFSVPIHAKGTPFQQAVWQALAAVPAGTTSTYAAIAQAIGRPAAVRAVGTAIGRNPVCILVPCHRILTSAGALGGYVAGLERKQALLNLELGYSA